MKRHIVMIAAAVMLLAACGPNRDKQMKAIAEHEQSLTALDRISDDSEVDELLSLYRTFANDFADDSLAPVYLTRAADLSIGAGRYQQAIDLLDSVIAIYPGYEDMGGCWFLKGYAFENAEQFDSARAAYTYFVDNYPDHLLAHDTRLMIDHLGMSPEEWLESLIGADSANATNQIATR